MDTPPAERALDLPRRATTVLLLALVAAAGAAYLLGIHWGLPAGWRTWAFDEIAPGMLGSKGRWDVYYPPAHRYVLGTAIRLVEIATGGERLGPSGAIVVMRSVSVAMALGSLLLVYRLGRRLGRRLDALLGAAALGFGTAWTFYAKTANLDVPYVFWFLASALAFVRALERARLADYACFAAAAALAVGTKDQAYGLYLLPPLLLAADLARRRPAGGRWRALLDRRLLVAAVVGAGLFLAVLYRWPWGSPELARHLAALRALPYEHYRDYGLSAAGVAELLRRSLDHLAFLLGLPVLAAAAAGLAAALARPRRNAVSLSLLAFALPYWAGFIVALGFNYDRHYLPIAAVLAVFAGRALGALARWRPALVPVGAVLAALVVGHAALRALSVDMLLLGDARYEAERYLDAEGIRSATAGLGPLQGLPRGVAAVPIDRFAPRRVGEHGVNPGAWHRCAVLEGLGVDWLIPERPELFRGPGLNWVEHKRFENSAPFSIVDFKGRSAYHSNIVKIGRDVVLFRRTEEACVDPGLVPRALHELRFQPDPARREAVARGIFESPATAKIELMGPHVVGARVYPDRLTAGRQPAGVAIRNPEELPLEPSLVVTVEAPEGSYPAKVWIEDGSQLLELGFERPGRREVKLAPVPPHGYGLAIVWTDTAWRASWGRPAGVRLGLGAEERLQHLLSRLAALGESDDAAARTHLARAIARGDVPSVKRLPGAAALLAGAWPDGWSRGTQPLAVVVRNPTRRSRDAALLVRAPRVWDGEPVEVAIDGGAGDADRYPLVSDRVERVPLGKVPGRGERLFIVSGNVSWFTTEKWGVRQLGIRVVDVRIRGLKKRQPAAAGAGPG